MFNTGIISGTRRIVDKLRYSEIDYVPSKFSVPERLIVSESKAWVGLELIIGDIIEFSKIKTDTALEFGVEFGYSTAVLANFFKKVRGVDIFVGDVHAGFHGDTYKTASENLRNFNNIELIKSDYRDFIIDREETVDLIHVDIIHTYEDTYACGLWGAMHSSCTIFHDTQSYPDVKHAVADVAKATRKKFYNYRKCNGLGILI